METGHPLLEQLFALWSGKRVGRLLPARSDLATAELCRWFGHLALVEVTDGAGGFRFRLYGTALGALLGRDLTGLTVDALDASLRDGLRQDYSYACRERSPCVRTRRYPASPSSVVLRELILPLAQDGSQVDMLLVAAYPISAPAARGMRLLARQHA